MTSSLIPNASGRRAFLQRLTALSALGTAAPFALQLAAMGEAAAASAEGYKALVCVFLFGGNDHANTIVPYDATSHAALQAIRPNLIIARDTLAPGVLQPRTALADGRAYAFAPGLQPLLPSFNAGQLSVLLNIGTLVDPTTRAQYLAKSVRLPPKLFSHNDQQSFWQTSATEGAPTGWGGRMGDLFASAQAPSSLTAISVSGQASFLSGAQIQPYQISSSGPTAITGLSSPLFGSSAASETLRSLMTTPRAMGTLENELLSTSGRSIALQGTLASALAGASLATPFPAGSRLGGQLQMVAQLIAARASLGMRRQVFFVSLGGFDTHDNQLTTHPGLIADLGNSLAAFQQAMQELGVSDQVTTFTASDFGRTLTSNNDGSDHGWGSLHLAMGGAVAGGFVGKPPTIAVNGPDDVGSGRLVPTVAVDQLAATLGGWFGLSASEQLDVLPGLANFSSRSLPLFRA